MAVVSLEMETPGRASNSGKIKDKDTMKKRDNIDLPTPASESPTCLSRKARGNEQSFKVCVDDKSKTATNVNLLDVDRLLVLFS